MTKGASGVAVMTEFFLLVVATRACSLCHSSSVYTLGVMNFPVCSVYPGDFIFVEILLFLSSKG